MGRGSSTQSSTSTEMYVTSGLGDLMNPFTDMAKTMGRMLGNANAFAELSKQSTEAYKKVNGVPLKTVMAITSTDDKGNVRTNKMTYEITSIAKGDIPASVFEMPAGYTSVDLPVAKSGRRAARTARTRSPKAWTRPSPRRTRSRTARRKAPRKGPRRRPKRKSGEFSDVRSPNTHLSAAVRRYI